MSALLRFSGALADIDEDSSGGILCSEGVKRDGAEWLVDGITWHSELPLNVEHAPPPAGVFTRLGPVTLPSGVRALAGVWRWGPQSVPRVSEVRALVKAGIYNALSSGILPLDQEYRNGTLTITRADLLECSLVSVPADPMAKITQRSLDSYTMGRVFRSLPRLPAACVDRMMDLIVQRHRPERPVGLMRDYERQEFYREQQRSRTMAGWALGEATEAEEREVRRARVAALKGRQ